MPGNPCSPRLEVRVGDPRLHLLQVVARAEGPPGTGQKHHRDSRITVCGAQCDRRGVGARRADRWNGGDDALLG